MRPMHVPRIRLSTIAAASWATVFALLIGCPSAPPSKSVETESTPNEDAPAEVATSSDPPAAALPEELWSQGWISLFDGETLFGWKWEGEADWRVEQGAITVSKGEKGLLYTSVRWRDYVLQVDFKSDPGTNSGIFLQTASRPTNPSQDCYELNIAPPDNPFPTGSLVGRQKVEGTYDSTQWQSYEVTVRQGHVVVRLDGQIVLDYQDPQPLETGHIGLQLNEGRVQFKNIKLKPLGMQPLLDGKSLEGWKTYPDMPGEFVVNNDGFLHVTGGRGQLESVGSYGDFILQLEGRTNAPRLNSGIFFRCIPGEKMNGYESQIHHGMLQNDPLQPEDYGTGAIFRRVKARRIVAQDQQWFGKTIVADGARIAVWVNGYQVTDWEDTRPEDPNPRKGLRRQAGTLMIQAHDPTTDLDFRKINLLEL